MSAGDLAHLHAVVRGRVQGVYFRAHASRRAQSLRVTGYVRNLSSGEEVALEAEGPRDRLEELLAWLRVGPPGARVDRVEAHWSPYTGAFPGFEVRH